MHPLGPESKLSPLFSHVREIRAGKTGARPGSQRAEKRRFAAGAPCAGRLSGADIFNGEIISNAAEFVKSFTEWA